MPAGSLQYDRGYLPGIFMQVLQTYFLLSRTYFSLPPSYFLLSAQKKFVTKFVTRITNFVTYVRNFVTHVRNFVTKTFLWDRKKFVGETKILLGTSKKYPAHSCISLRGASSLLRLRCADILFIGNYLAENRDFPAYFVNFIYQIGWG